MLQIYVDQKCLYQKYKKLLEQPLKVLERVVERRLRNRVQINEMQFGFTPGRGTTYAIFIVRQLQE